MPSAMVRMKPHEQEQLDELAYRLNKVRIEKRKKVLRDSTILHELLELALDDVAITEDGEIYLKKEGENLYYRK